MLVIRNPRKLPKQLPPDVHFACFVAGAVEETLEGTCELGTTTAQLLRLVHVPGHEEPSVGLTSMDWGFKNKMADAVEQLKDLGGKVLLSGPRGRHIGLVLVCEMWRLRDDPEVELAELIDGTVSREPHELRVALGALLNGWHLSLQRPRDGRATLRVARPQDSLKPQYFSPQVLEQLHRLNRDFADGGICVP